MLLRNRTSQWGLITIAIHWISALTVIGLFALGLWMVELTYYDNWYQKGPALHESIGMALFVLTLVRLLWRSINITPDGLPSHKRWEHSVATVVIFSLYLLLLGVMVSGYLISTADGRGIELFGLFTIPATLYGIEQQEDIAGEFHLIVASTLIGIALLHAGAALKHHFIDHDRTLRRMVGL
ncbi:MAG: cytochrome b [Chromatiales bacterium]|nr:cytochrome b [Chromatiales bacterium]